VNWADSPPREPGFYWMNDGSPGGPIVVQVDEAGDVWNCGDEFPFITLADVDGNLRWSTRLEPPKAVAG
jgi:hypothetical protein